MRSTYPDIEIPDLSVYDYLFGSLSEEQLGEVALIDGTTGVETTYAELVARIDGVAGALAARGVGRGDIVALHCPNSPAFAVVFHGILRTGATVTTLNSLYTPGEVENQLRDAGAQWLFTVSPLLPASGVAATAVGLAADHVIVLDGADGHPSLGDLLAERATPPHVEIDAAHDIAVLPYSSGTTGRPKGVRLTHRNLVANVEQSRASIGLAEGDRVLAVLPFFHIYGLTVLLNYALKCGAALVTMPRFDLAEFLRIIGEHRTTWLFIAPPIAVALAKHPAVADADTSSVKVVFSGAAPLDGALAAAVATRLDCAVRQGYGMTELSPVSHVIPVDRDDIPLDTVGLALPNTECRLVDPETMTDVAPGESGELWVRGPQVMQGYLGQEESTAWALVEDGWCRTGDIATVTADGVFQIVDRLKELIKYKGYQVAPAVLEAVLLRHPKIADVAVVGWHDDDAQEVPKAFVVVQPGETLEPADVMAYVAEHVAPHEKVRLVEFIDVIPKSTSGKILRKDLRARERAELAG